MFILWIYSDAICETKNVTDADGMFSYLNEAVGEINVAPSVAVFELGKILNAVKFR